MKIFPGKITYKFCWKKTSKSLGVVRRLSKILPKEILLTLYNTLIQPYLQYCNVAWGVSENDIFNKLFIILSLEASL